MGGPAVSNAIPEIRRVPMTLDLPEGRIEAEIDLPIGPEPRKGEAKKRFSVALKRLKKRGSWTDWKDSKIR